MRNKKSLLITHPEIAKQWHPTKNGELTPDQVTAGSGKKVWWKCPKGPDHEWKAAPYSRAGNKKSGCPCCTGKKVSVTNSLKSLYPDIADEWHPTKNGDLTSDQVTAGSGKKVWWKCPKELNHEWQATVSNRTGLNRGCPLCWKTRRGKARRDGAVRVKGSVSSTHPRLLEEWDDDLSPHEYSAGSHQNIWWKCLRGHRWKTTIYHRTSVNGTGCPFCSPQTSRPEIRIYCELETIFPDSQWRMKDMGKEIDIYIPSIKTGIEEDGFLYHQSKEKQDLDLEKNKYFKDKGIKLFRIRGRRLGKLNQQDVLYTDKEIRKKEIDALLIKLSKGIDNKYIKTVSAYIDKKGFQANSKYKVWVSRLPGPRFEDSIAATHPHLTKEWDDKKNKPLTPDMFSSGSDFKVYWCCEKGHNWLTTISNRTAGKGCRECYLEGLPNLVTERAIKNHGSLNITHPALAEEWDKDRNIPLTADDVSHGSQDKVWWKCSQDHNWQATINNRARGRGCPECALKNRAKKLRQNALKSGKNPISITHPDIAKMWIKAEDESVKPSMVTAGSGLKVLWRCKSGHERWRPVHKQIKIKRCPICEK